MTHFVLVHGAWHGAWCWAHVVSALEDAGHVALAVDLPGTSREAAPSQVTLGDCVDTVVRAIERVDGPVWLVGHSLSGATVAQACERIFEKVAGLVFVAASVPMNGQSHLDALGDDPDSLAFAAMAIDAEQGLATIPPSHRKDCFYSDCSPDRIEQAMDSLADWQALGPAVTPVELTAARFGSVPRYYVECLHDRTISLEVQRRMHRAAGMTGVVSLQSGHSPFLSMPGELATRLAALARG